MLITTATDHQRRADDQAIVLRVARPQDGAALRRLALLDDAAPLAGEVLIAEQGGEPRAAISLHSGRTIADPFRRTAHLVALLDARASLLDATRRKGARRPRLLSRLRPA
jgi:hypothetical protein